MVRLFCAGVIWWCLKCLQHPHWLMDYYMRPSYHWNDHSFPKGRRNRGVRVRRSDVYFSFLCWPCRVTREVIRGKAASSVTWAMRGRPLLNSASISCNPACEHTEIIKSTMLRKPSINCSQIVKMACNVGSPHTQVLLDCGELYFISVL